MTVGAPSTAAWLPLNVIPFRDGKGRERGTAHAGTRGSPQG